MCLPRVSWDKLANPSFVLGDGGEKGLPSMMMGKKSCDDKHHGNSVVIKVGATGLECADLVVCSE